MNNLKGVIEVESNLSSSNKPERTELERSERVQCPALGDIAKDGCLEHQARPLKLCRNPFKLQMWRECRNGCPNSLIGPDENPIELDELEAQQTNGGLSFRIKSLIKSKFKNNHSLFVQESGISQGALKRYLAGGDPSRSKLIAMAKAANVNLLWLATGEGPKYGEPKTYDLDCQALLAAIEVVDEVGATLPLAKRARLVKLAYTLYIRSSEGLDQGALKELVREALSQTM